MIKLIEMLNLIEDSDLRETVINTLIDAMQLYNNLEKEEEQKEEQQKEEEQKEEVKACLINLTDEDSQHEFSKVYVFDKNISDQKIKEISLRNALLSILEDKNTDYFNNIFFNYSNDYCRGIEFVFRISKKQILK